MHRGMGNKITNAVQLQVIVGSNPGRKIKYPNYYKYWALGTGNKGLLLMTH